MFPHLSIYFLGCLLHPCLILLVIPWFPQFLFPLFLFSSILTSSLNPVTSDPSHSVLHLSLHLNFIRFLVWFSGFIFRSSFTFCLFHSPFYASQPFVTPGSRLSFFASHTMVAFIFNECLIQSSQFCVLGNIIPCFSLLLFPHDPYFSCPFYVDPFLPAPLATKVSIAPCMKHSCGPSCPYLSSVWTSSSVFPVSLMAYFFLLLTSCCR